MRKSFALLALALAVLLPPELSAQSGTLTGVVRDRETDAPISGAEIQILPAGRTVYSDAEGRFTTSLAAGTYSLVVETMGFASVRRSPVRIHSGATTDVALHLDIDPVQGDEIVVTASRTREKTKNAPNMTDILHERELGDRPVPTIADHLRSTPGVDLADNGIQSKNVVVRGFNNAFSGALHFLTDYRLAGLPSLRVNLFHFVPANSEDLERIEVVLGPASALYGPNTANGVVHVLTKSPLDGEETVVAAAGGERSLFQGAFRTSHILTGDSTFGIKLSGQYQRGDEWEYTDPVERSALEGVMTNPDSVRAVLAAMGVPPEEIEVRMSRIGRRDFDMRRWSWEARADWRVGEEATAVFQAGMTNADGIELTGVGAGQTRDWRYSYYQARFHRNRMFAQAYLNTSDAGDSFLLRQGASLVDRSRMWSVQLQHGFSLADGAQDFTYGADYFRTEPRTEGTIHGQYEGDDEITEVGAYVQSRTRIGDRLELLMALRGDDSSVLDDLVWSPRAGLIFRPVEGQSLRLTYNRAFSTPTTLNTFLDINAGPTAGQLGSLGYFLRATGPGMEGLHFMRDGALLGMRSPFTPVGAGGPGQLLPPDVSHLYQFGLGLVHRQGIIDDATYAYLSGFTPTNSQIGINLFNPSPNAFSIQPVEGAMIADTPPLKESITTTYELGYQGLIRDRISVAADVWYSERTNFTSPLLLRTPLLTMDQADLVAFFQSVGLSPEQAAGLGGALGSQPWTTGTTGAPDPGIPLAVASSDDVTTTGADMIVSYINFGEVDLWGADLKVDASLSERWTLGGMASWVSDDHFDVDGQLVALNAPDFKGALSLGYRDVVSGLSGEVRLRHTAGFPVNSAEFVGTECIGGVGPLVQPCVEDYTLVDLLLGYELSRLPVTLQLSVTNVFDEDYRSFVGVPPIGRLALFRVKWDLR